MILFKSYKGWHNGTLWKQDSENSFFILSDVWFKFECSLKLWRSRNHISQSINQSMNQSTKQIIVIILRARENNFLNTDCWIKVSIYKKNIWKERIHWVKNTNLVSKVGKLVTKVRQINVHAVSTNGKWKRLEANLTNMWH